METFFYIFQYFICFIIILGGVNAGLQKEQLVSPRRNLGMAILISLFVAGLSIIGVLAVFLLTGFFENGWTLKMRK